MPGRYSVLVLLAGIIMAGGLFPTGSTTLWAQYFDVEVHLNGGEDVAYIGETNIIEIWIANELEIESMSLGFEFDIGRTYDFDATYGSFGYTNPEGNAVGAFPIYHGEVQGINDANPDSLLLGGAGFTGQGIPPQGIPTLCYTMAVYIGDSQAPLVDGFCIDNIFYPPAGTWAFANSSVLYVPFFQGEPNSSDSDPDAPAVCFDIVDRYGTPPQITNCPTAPLIGPHNVGVTYQFSAVDPDPGDILSWMVISGPGTIDQTGLYVSQDMEPNMYPVEVEVTDLANNSDICQFDIILTNEPPFFTNCLGDTTITSGETLLYDFDADDPDFCSPLTFTLENVNPAPAGQMIIDVATGLFMFEPDPLDVGTTFDVIVGVADPHEITTCEFAIEVRSALTNINFYQLDWYDPFETLVLPYSVWGKISFTYVPDAAVTQYLNLLAALPGDAPQWVIRNLPLFPSLAPLSTREAADLDLSTLGVSDGDPVSALEFALALTDYPLTAPPVAPISTAPVTTLARFAWDNFDTDGWTFENPGVPEQIQQQGEATAEAAERDVRAVQEDPRQCFTGACARSLDWLNRAHSLGISYDAQGLYGKLRMEGVGSPTPGETIWYDEWIEKKNTLARSLSGNRIVTKVWDSGTEVRPLEGITESTEDFLTWLRREIKTEDVELCYKGSGVNHAITIVDVYEDEDGNICVKYRDDVPQGNAAGDTEIQNARLVRRPDGKYGFKNANNYFYFGVSESVQSTATGGSTEGYPVRETFTIHQNRFEAPQTANDLHFQVWTDSDINGYSITVNGFGSTTATPNGARAVDVDSELGSVPYCTWLKIDVTLHLTARNEKRLRNVRWTRQVEEGKQEVEVKACPDFGWKVDPPEEVGPGQYLHRVYLFNDDLDQSITLNEVGFLPYNSFVEDMTTLETGDFSIFLPPVSLPPQSIYTYDLIEYEGLSAHVYGHFTLTEDEATEPVVEEWFDHPTTEYFCGDCNADELVNITDAVYLIQYIFNGGPAPVPVIAGDANCDGLVNITDAVYLINFIFTGGAPPCDTDNNEEPDC